MSRLIKTIADGETTYREAREYLVPTGCFLAVELSYCEQLEKRVEDLEAKIAVAVEALENCHGSGKTLNTGASYPKIQS